MKNKENKLILILVISFFVSIVIGGTLAYWYWHTTEEEKTNVTLTVTANYSCSADGGPSINNNNGMLAPAACTNPTYAIKRPVKINVTNNLNSNIYLDMWLNIDQIDSGLSNTENFKYALTTNPDSCTEDLVLSGNFKGTKAGDKVSIMEGKSYPTTMNNDTYYLYVWLDAAETSSDTQDQNFSLSLGGVCTNNYSPKPNKPVLDDGMIPVKISNTGVVTTVSENDQTWYDYDNKQWANAVLVKETGTKTRAQNKVAGTTINPNDILAYFVWIPRYSYKVWQYEGVADTVQEQTIDIKFVKNTVKETATKNGEYYTHPAFTFGNKELDGIWVGKFETSTDKTNTCYRTPNATNCTYDKVSPRIVPTVDSLRYQTVSNEFQTALKFAGGSMTNNIVSFIGSTFYGLTTATDSHMMKNSEWGAVAYLSHSKYGINTEIRKNNFMESSSNYYRTSTGCGADSANANTTTTVTSCAIPYGTPSSETYPYPQSTTGNISGIFDMSGGAAEYTMGNWGNTTGTSGFAAAWFTNNSKYYNLYASNIFTGNITTNFTFCTLATCGGHALNETKSWYSDSAVFVNSSGPWMGRAGNASGGAIAGAFRASGNSGVGGKSISFRGVLVASGVEGK